MDAILVVNAGSFSLKFQLFALERKALSRRIRGQIDGIGRRPRLKATGADGEELVDRTFFRETESDLPATIAETSVLPDYGLWPSRRAWGAGFRPPGAGR